MRAVAISGLGALGAWGAGREALARALESGQVCAGPIDRSAGWHAAGSAELAALVPPAATRAWIAPAAARRMSAPSRFAVAAAAMAAADAGLDASELASDRTAVVLGTAFGSTAFSVKLLEQVVDQGPQNASPFLFMETVANAAAGQVALAFGCRGPNATITAREASALAALAHAARLVADGRAERVLAGAVDEMAPMLHAVLDRFGALARRAADGRAGAEPTEAARPFDRARSGFLAGEGAAVLVLEPEQAARARGARVYGRVRAAVRARDASASASSWGHGAAALAERLRAGLERADVSPASITRVVSGASGSRAGDALEARTLAAFFAAEDVPPALIPPVLTPKGVTGEYGGGQLAAAILALAGGVPWPAAGFREADPELGIVPCGGCDPLPPARRLLASALAAGGGAAWVVLEAP
jgi:3-oxoacyl-[acyl-carrier-protein] synthase II